MTTMTRRQFLACLLMALVVLVCLPLAKFTEWGEKWFGRGSYGNMFVSAVNRAAGTIEISPGPGRPSDSTLTFAGGDHGFEVGKWIRLV